ncbi:hypothetical protein JFL43_17625 [Viridibacillus sp. YIM B01967]|uniref:Uncharacterized protein n=1 Tax=Viridibacillus soli TaxID=2798301 RepID=A0ABS1HB79_9BACL|nr:hypothetical protein [Viridibacillus soli]MBK3496646.1 hypothetical protein [Viridibacillus soli]
MISIQSTENLTGARISGDFWDFDELVHAIHHITTIDESDSPYEGARIRVLSVCYDIRHAAQGDHNIEFVMNGMHKDIMKSQNVIVPEQNVYLSVEILWPELLFTTIALNEFIQLYKGRNNFHYWNLHMTTIQKFQANVIDCLKDSLKSQDFKLFMSMIQLHQTSIVDYAIQYIDLLNLKFIHMSLEERQASLSTFAYKIAFKDTEYIAFKKQILKTASIIKSPIYEMELSLEYPEEIEW